MEETIAVGGAGRLEQARTRMASAEGLRVMRAVRDTAAQMLSEENRLLAERRVMGVEARRTAILATWAASCLGVLLIGFVAWATLRDRARVQRAEAELAITLRSVGDAVISTDARGTIRFMNAIAEDLTGRRELEARGRPLETVFKIINEHTRAPAESPVAKVLREGSIVGLANHTVLLTKDSAERAIEDSAAPIRDVHGNLTGVVLVFRDATSHRQAALKLLQSEGRFRAAVDAVQGVLWTNTAEGEMRGEQPGWAALTGQTFEDYQGLGWAKAVHPEDAQPTIDAWLAAVRERRPFSFEHRVRRHDGQWRNFSVRAIPILDATQGIREWVGVHTDITEQRLAEQGLREANTRKDVFLATLSHELRNPLAPIRTSARFLESGKLGPQETARSHAIISRQVRHMASLLDDLLDVSRITRGVLVLKREPVFLLSVLEGAVEAARPSIDTKRHVLNMECPAESIEMDADPVRLTQVATNLLTNAAKYTDPEGTITFGARLEEDALVIYVRDTGIGIAPDMVNRVFDMFTQVQAEAERSEGGLGIGLALVKGLVELHGGKVEVHSAGFERGCEFRVLLPRSIVRVLAREAQQVTPCNGAGFIRGHRVLIADDNRDGAESLGMLLELSGHEIFLAHTGPDALELCAEQRPRIGILDIGMPGMSGFEVAQRIRAAPWGAETVLIAVTGYGHDNDKAKAQAAGFDHHLTKPVDPSDLEKLINAVTLLQ
jgi:PAS domain S-box-containing protein